MSAARLSILLNMAMRDALRARGGEPVTSAEPPDDWSRAAAQRQRHDARAVAARWLAVGGGARAALTAVATGSSCGAAERSRSASSSHRHLCNLVTAMLGTLGIAPGIPAARVPSCPGCWCSRWPASTTWISRPRSPRRARRSRVEQGARRGVASRDREVFARSRGHGAREPRSRVALGAAGINLIRNLSGMQMFFADLATLDFVLFLAAIVAVTSVAAGAYPAFLLSRFRPLDALRKARSARARACSRAYSSACSSRSRASC